MIEIFRTAKKNYSNGKMPNESISRDGKFRMKCFGNSLPEKKFRNQFVLSQGVVFRKTYYIRSVSFEGYKFYCGHTSMYVCLLSVHYFRS